MVAEELPGKALHGGMIKRYRELTGKDVIDFSASLNPFPPDIPMDFPPSLLDYYPDDDYQRLKECIGKVFDREPGEIAVGNGSIELIRAFCLAKFRHGGSARISMPTFGEYLLSVQLGGGVLAGPGEKPGAVFLCNPNNPTGVLTSREKVSAILDSCQEQGSTLLLDEAFIELSDPGQSLVDTRDPGLFLVRSLTKCFSVPGLRFGYAFGDPGLVSMVERLRAPWSVNAFAEHFALLAFSKYNELENSRLKIKTEREYMTQSLGAMGLVVTPSDANFILVDTGGQSGSLCRRLLDHGVLARDCSSFGLPSSIRVSVRTRPENNILLGALSACLH